MKKNNFLPEGQRIHTARNYIATATIDGLKKAMADEEILEGIVRSCTVGHDLLIPLGDVIGMIPRDDCALGITNGTTREIAILSRVGKPVCFRVVAVDETVMPPRVLLSRCAAQQEALTYFMQSLHCGDIIPARVTHLESFGAFVDIGCGVTALIGIENLSISRIFHPSERIAPGQDILTVVLQVDHRDYRVTLTHRELLGTWEQNAALFCAGETVQGVVRSVERYGVFVELTPNLSGLAEKRDNVHVGQSVSVYIKSILPERMKIKLTIIDTLGTAPMPIEAPHYFIDNGKMTSWVYTPSLCSSKFIMTEFRDT